MFRDAFDGRMDSYFKSIFIVQQQFDYWVMGGPILRNVNMAFDYDNNEILVFNALIPNKNYYIKEKHSSISVIMLITVGLTMPGIIIAGISKIKMIVN